MMRARTTVALAGLVMVGAGVAVTWMGAPARAEGPQLPKPEPPFTGKIGRTVKESKPDFPKAVTAPPGAPNVLLIMTDDVGFGAASTWGGPIPTPTMDRLAQAGLRYNEFHTTALCSPTRAALITGRNHHTASTGNIMEFATGYPGYDSLMSRSVGTIGEILKYNGYNTAWFGKNHNVPDIGSRARRAPSTCGRRLSASTTSSASSVETPTSGTRRSTRTPCRTRRPISWVPIPSTSTS
jgi:arylsulfatase